MSPRKIFALLDGPEEDTFSGICLGACKLLNHTYLSLEVNKDKVNIQLSYSRTT